MKPISTRMHGFLDYLSAAALLILPRLLKWNRTTVNLLTGAAVATTAYSLITDYELGVRRILPVKTHLALDVVQSLVLGVFPFAFQSNSKGDQKQEAAGLLGISILEGLIVAGTQTRPLKIKKFTSYLRQMRSERIQPRR